jgi:hypothetical protein
VAGALLLAAQPARADLFSAYLRGNAGLGVSGPREQVRDGGDPALGGAVGLEAGLRLLIFEVRASSTVFSGGGRIDRALLGLGGDLAIERLRISLQAGVGPIAEAGGALTGVGDAGHVGAVARVGGGVDYAIRPWMLVGVGVEFEGYVLPVGQHQFVTKGTDWFTGLRYTLRLGI